MLIRVYTCRKGLAVMAGPFYVRVSYLLNFRKWGNFSYLYAFFIASTTVGNVHCGMVRSLPLKMLIQ